MNRLLSPIPAQLAAILDAGYEFWQAGRWEAAQEQLETARRLAEEAGQLAALLSARQLLGNLAFARGNLEAAGTEHSFVLAESERVGLAVGVASSLHSLGLVAAALGEYDTATKRLDAAAEAYQRLGMPEAAALVHANREHMSSRAQLESSNNDQLRLLEGWLPLAEEVNNQYGWSLDARAIEALILRAAPALRRAHSTLEARAMLWSTYQRLYSEHE